MVPSLFPKTHDFKIGVYSLCPGKDVISIATGIMAQRVLEVADALINNSIKVGVIDLCYLKPI